MKRIKTTTTTITIYKKIYIFIFHFKIVYMYYVLLDIVVVGWLQQNRKLQKSAQN